MKLTPLGCNFELQVPSRNYEWYVNGYESFTSAIFAQFCKSSDLIIDLGAHVGYFTLLAASSNNDAQIIAVEASPDNFNVLAKNVRKLPGNIHLHNKVFSSLNGIVNFTLTDASDNSCVGGSEFSNTIRTIGVETVTGEDLLLDSKKNILIKIDLEGYELVALTSLEKTIRECANLKMIIEFNPRQLIKNNCQPEQFFCKLYDLGFRIFAINDHSSLWEEIKKEFNNYESLTNNLGYTNLVCIKSEIARSVCGVLHSSALGGGERSYLELAGDLISRGFLVHSILPLPDSGLGNELLGIGSSVSFTNQLKWWATNKADTHFSPEVDFLQNHISLEVTNTLVKVNPDIVLSSSVVFPQGAISAGLLDISHLWWIQEFADRDHGLNLPKPPKELGRVIEELSDGILCVSKSVRDHFFDVPKSSIKVVFPLPKLVSNVGISVIRNDDFRIGLVANFQGGKGHFDALYAIARLKVLNLQVKLILFGSGCDSDIQRLVELIRDLGIRDHVRFAGFLGNTATIYGQVDCILVTSKNEAFGRVPFEATDFGVPVIYSDSAGPQEYMLPNITGIPYRPGDIEALCTAIMYMQSSRALQIKFILGARRHLGKLYRDNPQSQEVFNILSELKFRPKDPTLLSNLRSAHAIAERDFAIAERDFAIAERDFAIAERNAVMQSVTWKIFSLYRWVKFKITSVVSR